MIKVVLFDVDGVLVNGPNLRNSTKYSELLEIKQEIFRGKFLDCLIGKADLKRN